MERYAAVQLERWEATKLLLRMLGSAYYDDDHIIVLETLLELDSGPDMHNNVTEVDLGRLLPLNARAIRHILHRLRTDGLICSIHRGSGADDTLGVNAGVTAADLGVQKDRRWAKGGRGQARTYVWFIDSERLCKVVKYRHTQIVAQLNQKADIRTEVYKCPNPYCDHNYEQAANRPRQPAQTFSLLELVQQSARNGNAADRTFRCDRCFATDPDTGVTESTPLVPVGEGLAVRDAVNEDRKQRFNLQLAPLFQQLTKLSDLLATEEQLQEEEEHRNSENERMNAAMMSSYKLQPSAQQSSTAQQAAKQAAKMQIDPLTGEIRVSAAEQPAAANGTSKAAVAPAGQSNAAANAGIGAPSQNMGNIKRVDHSKTKIVAPLPWDLKAEQRQKAFEEQQAKLEAQNNGRHEPVAKRQKTSSDVQYIEEYKKQLMSEKLNSSAVKSEHAANGTTTASHNGSVHNAAASVGSAMADATSDSSDPTIHVQGQPVRLSEVTQDEVERMTEEEAAVYDMYTAAIDV